MRQLKIFISICTLATVLFSAVVASAASEHVLLKLARVLAYQKKYEESLDRYQEYLRRYPKDYKVNLEAGDVAFWNQRYDEAVKYYDEAAKDPKLADVAGQKKAEVLAVKRDYKTAEELYRESLAQNPSDIKTRIQLARILSYDKKYDESIREYNKVLETDPDNMEALRGKADVLSWDKQYDESVKTYDELLAVKYDADAARQKARVLGWARRYGQSLQAYHGAYEKTGNKDIEGEGKAKQAYWNKWTHKSIKKYQQLLTEEPQNVEARFDLAQIEAYERMYRQAANDFQLILNDQPHHFRAQEGLDKVNYLWKKRAVIPVFRWFRANSTDRSTDINRITAGSDFAVPLHQAVSILGAYYYDLFRFKNAASISRHQGKIGVGLSLTPWFWLDAAYLPTGYPTDNRFSHLFDTTISARPFDPIIISAFAKRDDLFNQRVVFDKKLRNTDIGGKVQANIHRRWVAYADYRYRIINDSNRQHNFGIENLIYLLYEPYRLTADIRFDYQDWKRTILDYWSPQNFWHVMMTLHWRHYLNPNGLYFGAKDTFYGVKYRFQLDKDKKPFNGGALEFHRDWYQYFSTHVEAFGDYSSEYWDAGIIALATVRF